MNHQNSATAGEVVARRRALRSRARVGWRRPIHVAVGVALAASLAACSSGENSAADSHGSITIMNIGSYTTPPYAFPQLRTGAQAAVARINKDGGINGQKVKLLTCDDKGNPNGAATCARQAVAEKVNAVVGTFTFFGDSVVPLLEKAGIPDILPLANSALEGTSKVSFPVITTGASSSALLATLADSGCKKVAVMSPDLAPSRANVKNYMSPAAKALGVEMVPAWVSPTATDMSPVVSQMLSAGADCFEWGLGVQQTNAGLLALHQAGAHVRSDTAVVLMPESLLGPLGDAGAGLLAVSNYYYPSTGKPAAIRAGKDITAVDPKAPVDETSLNSYAAVLVFAKPAEGLDHVNAETVLRALGSMKTFDVGLLPPVDLSRAGFIKDIPRAAATMFPIYVARDGKYVPSSPGEVDVSPAFG